MEKNAMVPKIKIIQTHLKIHWKLIIFFVILWVAMSIGIIFMYSSGGNQNNKIFIAPTWRYDYYGDSFDGNLSSSSQSYIGTALGDFIYGLIGTIFFGFVSIFFLTNVINREIKTGHITFWMTSYYSRKQILLSKVFFVWIAELIMFAPTFIITLIFSGIADDCGHYIGYVIYDCFSSLLFNLLILSIFAIISLAFLEKNFLASIINSLILLYVLVTWIMKFLYKANPDAFAWAKYSSYISIQSLLYNPLNFKDPIEYSINNLPDNIKSGDSFFSSSKIVKQNIPLMIILPIISLSCSCGLIYTGAHLFKNKDLRI